MFIRMKIVFMPTLLWAVHFFIHKLIFFFVRSVECGGVCADRDGAGSRTAGAEEPYNATHWEQTGNCAICHENILQDITNVYLTN
jgi:hypothetical protein